MTDKQALVGFFGKIPARGDFVSRNLDADFRTALESWLDRSLSTSRKNLGDDWLDLYLTAPLWRFIMGTGLCGPAAAGIVMPSVDKVGRYYPLVIAATLPGCHAPSRLFKSANQWFQDMEQIALATLEEDASFDIFEEAVLARGLPDDGRDQREPVVPTSMTIAEGAGIDNAYTIILDKLMSGHHSDFSLWWTSGSDRVEASLLFSPGMPEPIKFSAFLDGNWNRWNWKIAKPIAPASLGKAAATPEKQMPPQLIGRSDGASHPGTLRTDNQDAWSAADDSQIYCVADGVGGHDKGDYASRTVTEIVQTVSGQLSFQDKLKAVMRATQTAHDRCLRQARGLGVDKIVASTVAILLLDKDRYALVWAGDSRVYQLRDQTFTCLTTDHVEETTGFLTKAVGWGEWLEPDVRIGDIRVGDRFLLVSDGITKMLPLEEVDQLLENRATDHAVRALMESALIAGATDNITALVVDVVESGAPATQTGRTKGIAP